MSQQKPLNPRSVLCSVLLCILLIGCTESPTEPLRIASSPWPGYEPLYLARDLGYFNKRRVNIFELPSSDITMESFRNHSTDLATLTLDEALQLLHDGILFRIVLIMDISSGGDAVLAGPDIKTLSDLKGKNISIVNIPLGLYMLSRTLDNAGLTRSDVNVFPMPESRQVEFFKQGKADVVITFEPIKTNLLNLGAHVVFDSSKIPNEIFDMLLVHEDVYQKRKADVCHVVKQWFKSLAYIDKNRKDAALRITRRLGINDGEFEPMMSGIILPTIEDNRKILWGHEPLILGPAAKLGKIMQDEHMLDRQVDLKNTIDPLFNACISE